MRPALLAPLLLVVALSSSHGEEPSSSSSSSRKTCDVLDDETLLCRLRTIANVRALLKDAPPSVARLSLLCSDVLFFESHLEPDDFAGVAATLRHLAVDRCKIRRVPAGAFARLRDLRTLALRTRDGDWSSAMALELERDSFEGLAELRELDLSANNVRDVPEDAFCPLRSLKRLNLTANRVRDVRQLGGACGGALEVLDASGNEIAALPDDALHGMRSLTELYLQDNSISTMGDRALFGLASLQVLNATSNFLVSLPPDLFQSSRAVKQVLFANNSISVLAPGLFDALDQLQVLDLSRNELTSRGVNRDTFSGLVRIVVLNLARNHLTRVDALVFRDLYSLQVLNLENNKINYIADGAFKQLKNLYLLTLSNNALKTIEAHHFIGLYVLEQLSLDDNRISAVHRRAFENVTNLQHLDLGGNDLHRVPHGVRNLRLLRTLDLGKNNISWVNSTSFEGLDQLYGLRLVDNAVGEITLESFINLPSLQILNLASNRISRIERGAFSPNAKLKVVRLDDNELSDITGIFGDLKELGWLNVSDNRIVRFDYTDMPNNLEWLDLHSNLISKLPQYVSLNRVNLKMLDVSFNLLTEVGGGVLPVSVENLYLNNNNISYIDAGTFVNKGNLQKVILFGNNLRKLDMNAFALTPVPDNRDLPQFFIGGNPFECDCAMEWLQRINQLAHTRRYPQVMDLDLVFCSLTHSRTATTRSVVEMRSSQFLCPYDSHCFALCHCCDFDACDCEMTCPDGCSCYHDLAWSANVVDCSRGNHTQIPRKIPMDATEIYLDGNDLSELGSHVFIGKKKLEVLYLNDSNLRSVHNRTFKGVESLKVLHLENNKIKELRGDEFDQLHDLNELYLDHNSISHVGNDTFRAMKKLEVLRLDENKIVDFSPWQMLASSSSAQVSLEGNEWSCDCRFVAKLDSWLRGNPGDPEKMFCDGRRETVAAVLARCGREIAEDRGGAGDVLFAPTTFIGQNVVSIFAGCLVATLVVCACLALAFALFRQDVRLWAHSKYGVRIFKDATPPSGDPAAAADYERELRYDAYVVYGAKDEDFARVLGGELERSGYSICMHYRDVDDDSCLSECVADASRRIVVVLTPNFLALEWANYDMRASLLSALKNARLSSRDDRVIFVLTTDVSAVQLDADLQLYLRSHGAFYWGEKRFWEKLRFAMPDVAGPPALRYTATPTNRHHHPGSDSHPDLHLHHPHPHRLHQHLHHQTMPSSGKVEHQQQPECSSRECGGGRSMQRGGRTYFV